MLRYFLSWFQQNFDGMEESTRNTVRVSIRHFDTVRNKIIGGEDGHLSNKKLQEHAENAGRSTWDEADVCAVASEVLGVKVEIAPTVESVLAAENPSKTA